MCGARDVVTMCLRPAGLARGPKATEVPAGCATLATWLVHSGGNMQVGTLRKPGSRSAEATQLHASETAVSGAMNGSVRVTRGELDADGGNRDVRNDVVNASSLHYVDSASLALLGLAGRVEALINTFVGHDVLVTTDEFALLNRSTDTLAHDQTVVALSSNGGAQLLEAMVQVPRSDFVVGSGVFGNLVSDVFQYAEGVGPFAQQWVELRTLDDGSFTLSVRADFNSDSGDAYARYLADVDPLIQALAASVDNVAFTNSVQLEPPPDTTPRRR